MAVRDADLALALAGLDALETVDDRGPGWLRKGWTAAWPKLLAIAIALGLWQVLDWTDWRPDYALAGPAPALRQLSSIMQEAVFWKAIAITAQRALVGYAVAIVVGLVVGIAVARVRTLRSGVGALITGLQTMPSIAWFPLAIVLFKLSEQAILFVVVLGAAPSIANGLISGVDHVPPILVRAGRVLGARGLTLMRHVVLPAALPACVGGLKQGWAFAWRSLMAGELIVIVANKPSLGSRLTFARELSQSDLLIAYMIVILVIGILVDSLFGRADRAIRRRWGLMDAAS